MHTLIKRYFDLIAPRQRPAETAAQINVTDAPLPAASRKIDPLLNNKTMTPVYQINPASFIKVSGGPSNNFDTLILSALEGDIMFFYGDIHRLAEPGDIYI